MCGKLRGMPQENGKLSLSTLTRLSVGGYLTTAAANSFERLRLAGARDGVNVTITSTADAYREYAIQERIFTERYLPTYTQYAPGKVDRRLWQGRYWFRRAGTAAAAVPGTSNHGWAIAIDIANVGGFNSTFYRWLSNNAPALGWSNDEGRSVNEAWHWTFRTSQDTGGGGSSAPTPTPTPEEDDDMPLTDADIQKIWAYKNAEVEDDDIYAVTRAARDGTITTNEIYRLLTSEIAAAIARTEAAASAAKENTKPITRGGVEVSLRQEIANIGTAVAGLPVAIWNLRPTGVSTMADMIIALKQRVIDGHPPTKPLTEMAEIKTLLEEK